MGNLTFQDLAQKMSKTLVYECLGRKKDDMTKYNTREINDIMRTALTNWEYVNSTKNFSIYGKQKYYKRR